MSALRPHQLAYAAMLARASYRPVYTTGTRCPGCGGGHWDIGRRSAECVRCGTALPLGPEAPAK